MASKTQPTVALNDGAAMPQFGLGVFQTPPDETERVVEMAVDEGYRLVDTASMYRNEEGVGEALLGHTGLPNAASCAKSAACSGGGSALCRVTIRAAKLGKYL